jgi:hypothetical protein
MHVPARVEQQLIGEEHGHQPGMVKTALRFGGVFDHDQRE